MLKRFVMFIVTLAAVSAIFCAAFFFSYRTYTDTAEIPDGPLRAQSESGASPALSHENDGPSPSVVYPGK